jgi:delta1-piperideine-2-carboxylate reductase
MTVAERDLCHSHGLFRLPGYVTSLRSGKVNGKARPTARRIAPAVVQVDGDRGYAPLALQVGREPLAEAARANGIAALAIRRTHHFAALWIETSALAEMGLCAFAFTSYAPFVAPAGGKKPFFGTNPMSFAWPRRGKPPMVFDQASSMMARGEIQIAARDGHTVPLGAGIDADGNPTTDPNAILKGGAQLAFGGYKGASIALMIDLLAGPLIGEVTSYEAGEQDNKDGGPPAGGEFMIAIDPLRFGDREHVFDHAERLFAKLLEQEGTRLPADRRYENRKKTATTGIEIPQSLYDQITAMAKG